MAEERDLVSVGGGAPRSPRDGPSRFPLHYVYYALAAFDVVALTLSVAILVWIARSYENSVRANNYWAECMTLSRELVDRASEVNAPGNEAFGVTRPALPDKERGLDSALARFHLKLAEFEAKLQEPGYTTVAADVSAALDAVLPPMRRMVDEARLIFGHLERDRLTEAGRVMARMDADYADVIAAVGECNRLVSEIQQTSLKKQLDVVQGLRAVEVAFAAVILMIVGLVTVYGRRLAHRMRDFQRELTAYRDHLEALVEERTDELDTSLERLRLSDRLASIGTLAAGLGHDMNNVLFPVRCRLDALGAASLDAEATDDVHSIRQSVEYLQQLTDGLRLLSLDPDEDVEANAATDLQSWWDEVRPLFLTALPKEATLAGEISYDLRPVAVAAHRLTQAVFNLVVNAGAAIDERGLVRVWARPADDDATVQIGVSDDGRGMSEDVRRQALDPFFTTKKRGLSTGLGLSLVQGVATAAGGRVDVESSPGGGTTVTLLLPLAEPGAADAADAQAPAPYAAVSLADRRIATFFATLLQAAGFEVEVVEGSPPPTTRVWVTDLAGTTPGEASAFLGAGDGRRVIAFGRSAEEWKHSGVYVVDQEGGVDAMRAAITDICEVLGEGSE